MLVDDEGIPVVLVLQVLDPDVQGHLIVLIQAVPDFAGQAVGGQGAELHQPGLALEGGQGVAVALVGVDEVARAGDGIVVLKKVPAAAGGVAVQALEDGQVIGAVGLHHAGDAGGPVGAVGLELSGVQGVAVAVALGDVVPDGVGLVAVGHHQQAVGQQPDGVVDNQGGVGHFGLVEGLCPDAVLGVFKNSVAAVFAAAHDEIGDDRLVVGRAAHDDAPAGVGVFSEIGC